MIFKPEMVEKILAGEKTVTRRPVKTRFRSTALKRHARFHEYLDCRYEVGKAYAVCPGRGRKGVARIRILSVERGPLKPERCTISALVDEGRREGFRDWFGFCDYWRDLYDDFNPDQIVDRIEFELVRSAVVA